jgi:hypothetical protein
MARREDDAGAPAPATAPAQHYGRYVGLLALVILALITLNTILTKPNGSTGVSPGSPLPPFAVPLALGSLEGDADVATRADEGEAGRVPACKERGPAILNICALYDRGPVVLALFVAGGSCADVLGEMQALAPHYPGVRFAAVEIRGDRGQLRRLVRTRGLTFPVGIDRDGSLAALYKVASCPQVTLAYPGGIVQSKPLLASPAPGELQARVQQLVTASRARGWREGGGA